MVERYGLVERAPGGGGFRVLPAALEAARSPSSSLQV